MSVRIDTTVVCETCGRNADLLAMDCSTWVYLSSPLGLGGWACHLRQCQENGLFLLRARVDRGVPSAGTPDPDRWTPESAAFPRSRRSTRVPHSPLSPDSAPDRVEVETYVDALMQSGIGVPAGASGDQRAYFRRVLVASGIVYDLINAEETRPGDGPETALAKARAILVQWGGLIDDYARSAGYGEPVREFLDYSPAGSNGTSDG